MKHANLRITAILTHYYPADNDPFILTGCPYLATAFSLILSNFYLALLPAANKRVLSNPFGAGPV